MADLSIFDKVKSFDDYNQLDQEFQLKKAAAQQQIAGAVLDQQAKKLNLVGQIVGTNSFDQPSYDKARQMAASNGLDVSALPDQFNPQLVSQLRFAGATPTAQLSALIASQGHQLTAGKAVGDIGAYGYTGNPPVAAQTPAGSIGLNPMIPNLVKAESGGDVNALSPKGAAGKFQIMSDTARNPGYGVTPLQGWDGVDPRTAPVDEQERFSNDYLNALQAHNGGNPQLAAASYNAGPGRVDSALQLSNGNAQSALGSLPAETRDYYKKVAVPKQGETQEAYKARMANDPNIQGIMKGVETTAQKTAETESDRRAGYTKAQSALRSLEQDTALVNKNIDDALNTVQKKGSMATGYGQVFSKLPNTDSGRLNNSLATIKAHITFDKLQDMRANSPTGGALGQVSDNEGRLLSAVDGALDPNQEDQLVDNLQTIKTLYPQVLAERRRAFDQDYGSFSPIGNNKQSAPAPVNLTPRVDIGSIPIQAIRALKANPDRAADFDAKYGQGLSKSLLGK